MVATKADGTGAEWIKTAKEAGFDYLELPLAQMMALPASEIEDIRKALVENDIPCEACNNFFPTDMRLTGDHVNMDSIMAYAGKALERAALLGARRVVFGSGPAKNVPEGFSMEEGYRQVVALLKQVAPVAASYDIIISIEPLRKAECNLINTFEEGVRLAEDVASDSVKVLVDFYHLTEEREPVDHILKYGRENLRHVHFARPEGRLCPAETGEADYMPFIRALKEIGYDERISCEAYSKDFVKDSKVTVGFFNKHFR